MEPFTEWLWQQMHQQGLNCRTLAGGGGLTTCKIKQVVAQHVVPTAINVCRLAECFDVDPEAVLDLATTQTAATMPADSGPSGAGVCTPALRHVGRRATHHPE